MLYSMTVRTDMANQTKSMTPRSKKQKLLSKFLTKVCANVCITCHKKPKMTGSPMCIPCMVKHSDMQLFLGHVMHNSCTLCHNLPCIKDLVYCEKCIKTLI